MKNTIRHLVCIMSIIGGFIAGQAAGESGSATCHTWIQSSHSLNYANHGCGKYADTLTSVERIGGGVIPLGTNRFFIVWFPENWETLPNKRLIVTLHGNGGCAESLFQFWYKLSAQRNYAIAALQYAEEDFSGNLSFDDSVQVYKNLLIMLGMLHEHCSLDDVPVVLHGFSRGSARTFELALLDRSDDGVKAFSAFIADSGTVFPENDGRLSVLLQNAAPDAYRGARFWLYCGGRDHGGQTCQGMEKKQHFVLAHGGIVDEFYQYPPGGHGIFITATPQSSGPALIALFDYIDSLGEKRGG